MTFSTQSSGVFHMRHKSLLKGMTNISPKKWFIAAVLLLRFCKLSIKLTINKNLKLLKEITGLKKNRFSPGEWHAFIVWIIPMREKRKRSTSAQNRYRIHAYNVVRQQAVCLTRHSNKDGSFTTATHEYFYNITRRLRRCLGMSERNNKVRACSESWKRMTR